MKMSQILKFVYFTKPQKSRYFENKTFFFQIKIHYLHIKGYFLAKNTFVAEVTLSVKPKAAYKVSKYGPENTPYFDTFLAVQKAQRFLGLFKNYVTQNFEH